MADHASKYRAVLARIARPLTPEDGVPEEVIAGSEARLGIRLPESLRAYYLLAGRFDRFNLAHDRLLRPDQWECSGDKLVFLEENQSVVYWGVEASVCPGDDPPVFQGPNEGRPIEWYPETDRCTEFLIAILHWQAVGGGYELCGTADAPAEAIEEFVAVWTFAGRVGEMRSYSRDGAVACFFEGDGAWQLYVGGRNEGDFEAIERELSAVGIEIDQL